MLTEGRVKREEGQQVSFRKKDGEKESIQQLAGVSPSHGREDG